jgi:hypothetical protein
MLYKNIINYMSIKRSNSYDNCSSLHAAYAFLSGSSNYSFQKHQLWREQAQ